MVNDIFGTQFRKRGKQSERHGVSGADAEKIQLPSGPIEVAAAQERRMYVTRADVERYGPTVVCPGCTWVTVGGRTEKLQFVAGCGSRTC